MWERFKNVFFVICNLKEHLWQLQIHRNMWYIGTMREAIKHRFIGKWGTSCSVMRETIKNPFIDMRYISTMKETIKHRYIWTYHISMIMKGNTIPLRMVWLALWERSQIKHYYIRASIYERPQTPAMMCLRYIITMSLSDRQQVTMSRPQTPIK